MKTKVLFLSLAIMLLLLALILRASLDRLVITPEEQLQNRMVAGQIRGPITIGQTFTAPYNGLYRIDVMMATYARQNSQDVIFHLRKGPGEEVDLAEIVVNASEIEDNTFRPFTFDPIRHSAGRTYYFFFESSLSVPGDAVTIWGCSEDMYPNGQGFRNHRRGAGDLTFLTYYRPGSLGKASILLDRLAENKPLFWGDKRFYALLGLIYLSLFALFWVTVAGQLADHEGDEHDDSDRV
jgi:hypothetical protein